MTVCLSLKIDRIQMVLFVPSTELYSFYWGQLSGMKDIQKTLLPNGTLSLYTNKKKCFTALHVEPAPKRRIAELMVAATKSKHHYIKLSLYPGNLRAGELDMLNFWMENLLDGLTIKKLLKCASVSYLELAWDFLNKDNAAYIPYSPRARKSFVYQEKSEHKGGQYVGSVKSNRRFCFYDKARQLKEVYGHSNFSCLARVEARLKKTGLKPVQLLDHLDNPFLHLSFLSVQSLRQASEDLAWQSFVDDCEKLGVALPLWACDKNTRKLYQARLDAAKVQWWNPGKAWESWPKAFTSLLSSELLGLQSIAEEV